MNRLTKSQVEEVRKQLWVRQGCRCAICQLPVAWDNTTLDHDHKTGAIRAVLHRSCNAVLGKLENGCARFGVKDINAFASGVGKFLMLHKQNITGMTHPTHFTPEEKRLKTNARAVKLRAAKKKAATTVKA